jgi:hypothetical protein
VGPSGGWPIDLLVQNANDDNRDAYWVYSIPLRKGSAPKKYTVLADDCGGRLYVQLKHKNRATSMVDFMDLEEEDMLFPAMQCSQK